MSTLQGIKRQLAQVVSAVAELNQMVAEYEVAEQVAFIRDHKRIHDAFFKPLEDVPAPDVPPTEEYRSE